MCSSCCCHAVIAVAMYFWVCQDVIGYFSIYKLLVEMFLWKITSFFDWLMLKVDGLSYHLNLNWDQQVSSLIMWGSHMLFIMVVLNSGKNFYVEIMVEYERDCIPTLSKCFYSLWQTLIHCGLYLLWKYCCVLVLPDITCMTINQNSFQTSCEFCLKTF